MYVTMYVDIDRSKRKLLRRAILALAKSIYYMFNKDTCRGKQENRDNSRRIIIYVNQGFLEGKVEFPAL